MTTQQPTYDDLLIREKIKKRKESKGKEVGPDGYKEYHTRESLTLIPGFETFSSTGNVPQKRVSRTKIEEWEEKERSLTAPDDEYIRERDWSDLSRTDSSLVQKGYGEKAERDFSRSDLTIQQPRFGDDADTVEEKVDSRARQMRVRPGGRPPEPEPNIDENDPFYDSKYFEWRFKNRYKNSWPRPAAPQDYAGKAELALSLIKLSEKHKTVYGPEYAKTDVEIAIHVEASEEFVRKLRNEYRYGPPEPQKGGPGKGAPGRPRKRKPKSKYTLPNGTPWQPLVTTKKRRIKKEKCS
jgi:hypothetical protein